MTVTFLQLRPAESVNEIWATTRRREGTLAVQIDQPDEEDISQAIAGGLLAIACDPDVDAPAYVLRPRSIGNLGKHPVAGWRITIVDSGDRREVIDALAVTRASYLRATRSGVAGAVEMALLPGSPATVSVLVDTVDDAVAAVSDGAGDLVLRDWDLERLGELRDALAPLPVIERSAFPVGLEYDDVARELDAGTLATYLNQVDGLGRARPRSTWAPGRDLAIPRSRNRFSSAWADEPWSERVPDETAASPAISGILQRALDGVAPTRDEVEVLFTAHGDDVDAIALVADELRSEAVGDDVSFVVNRNINYTNQCYFKCGFCAFSKGPRSLDLRGEPYLLSIDEVVSRSVEAWERGATEVCLQGGIHPDFTGEFYIDLVRAVKAAVPDMHIHGFTPLEIWQGAETSGCSIEELLTRLQASGLGTLPGTAAEILDDDVRLTLCPDKIRTSQWSEVMLTAHRLGIRTTATMMFGHVDGPRSWANHIEVIREIQRQTGGFTEFVPLPFVHMGSPIWLRGKARPGPTWDEVILVHAVARIAFMGLIDNIQASWVKLGLDGAEALLRAGCNDVGGTLMDESISRAAGAAHGTEVTSIEFRELALDLDRRPVRRTTVYEYLETGITIGEPAP